MFSLPAKIEHANVKGRKEIHNWRGRASGLQIDYR